MKEFILNNNTVHLMWWWIYSKYLNSTQLNLYELFKLEKSLHYHVIIDVQVNGTQYTA